MPSVIKATLIKKITVHPDIILDESSSCNNFSVGIIHRRSIQVQIWTKNAATAWQTYDTTD